VYSLTIIIFELFSGIDPFPGHIGQIFQAKMSDKKPAIPLDFPAELKELVIQGWSKEPKTRPPIQGFKLALNKMLTIEGKDQCCTFQDNNYTEVKEELQISQEEVFSTEKTEQELGTSTIGGDPIKGFFNKPNLA
jgi:hypothetical protein